MPWSVGTVHINCVIKFSKSSSSRGKFQSIESVIVKEINLINWNENFLVNFPNRGSKKSDSSHWCPLKLALSLFLYKC